MALSREQLEQVPEVYRDFMLVLKPVVDSKAPGVVLRINGIPFGMVYEALSTKYGYNTEQVRELAHNLRAGGWIEEDQLGFFTPSSTPTSSLTLAKMRARFSNWRPPYTRCPAAAAGRRSPAFLT